MDIQFDNFAPEDANADNVPGVPEVPCYRAGDNAMGWIRDIGRNVVTPSYLLRRLAASSDPELKMAVADHMNTPLEVLMTLADDENADVRLALAENHNINRDVLNKLLDDINPYVVSRAQRTVSRLELDRSLLATWMSAHAS